METARDGRTWRIGTAAEVAWIANGTAIPAVFEAYATVHPLEDERIDVEECARVHHLGARSGDQPGGSASSTTAPTTYYDVETTRTTADDRTDGGI